MLTKVLIKPSSIQFGEDIMMKFLSFLKREKKEHESEDLDLPPLPPSLEGLEGFEDIPSPPGYVQSDSEKDFQGFPELPELQHADLDYPPQTFNKGFQEKVSLEYPSTVHVEDELINSLQEVMSSPKINTEFTKIPDMPVIQETEIKTIPVKKINENINYIDLENFRSIIGNIESIKISLKNFSNGLIKLEEIENQKENLLGIATPYVHDLHKKLILIDKSLFKGE